MDDMMKTICSYFGTTEEQLLGHTCTGTKEQQEDRIQKVWSSLNELRDCVGIWTFEEIVDKVEKVLNLSDHDLSENLGFRRYYLRDMRRRRHSIRKEAEKEKAMLDYLSYAIDKTEELIHAKSSR